MSASIPQDSTSGTTEAYEEAYESAKATAETNSSLATDAVSGAGASEAGGTSGATEDYPPPTTGEDPANPATDGTTDTAEPPAQEAYTDESSWRDAFTDWYKAQMTAYQNARNQWQDGVKTSDAKKMDGAAEQMTELATTTEPPADAFLKEAQADKDARAAEAKRNELYQKVFYTLKDMRTQVTRLVRGKAATHTEAQKQVFQKISQRFQRVFQDKAARDQHRQDTLLRSAREGLSELFTRMSRKAKDIAKEKAPQKDTGSAPETEADDETITTEEYETFTAEALEAGYDGVAGETDIREGDRKRVAKESRPQVKDMARAAEKRDFERARETDRTGDQAGAENTENAAETTSANAEVTTPDAQHIRVVIGALQEAGRLTKEKASALVKKLAEKAAKTMEGGAKILSARDDEEENRFIFNAAVERFVEVGEREADGETETSEISARAAFRNTTGRLMAALARGTIGFETEEGATRVADGAYEGHTPEEGILEWNRRTATGATDFSVDAETPPHVSQRARLARELARKGQVLAADYRSTVELQGDAV